MSPRHTDRRIRSQSLSRSFASTPSAIRTTPDPGFAASFLTSSTSSRLQRPPAANTIPPHGRVSAAISITATTQAPTRPLSPTNGSTPTSAAKDRSASTTRSSCSSWKATRHPSWASSTMASTPIAGPIGAAGAAATSTANPTEKTHPIWTQGGDEFARVTSQDSVTGVDGAEHVSDHATIWRWREAFQNDFAARMSWTVADFAHANHNPVAVVNAKQGTAPIEMDVAQGSPSLLTRAKAPTPMDSRCTSWFHYAEAGMADGIIASLTLTGAESPRVDGRGDSHVVPLWLPLIPCKGDGWLTSFSPSQMRAPHALTSYRRIILHVHPAGATANQ